jgi:hypothetical protein
MARRQKRAEAKASSTTHLLSRSRRKNLLLLTVVLVNLRYVVRIRIVRKHICRQIIPIIQDTALVIIEFFSESSRFTLY